MVVLFVRTELSPIGQLCTVDSNSQEELRRIRVMCVHIMKALPNYLYPLVSQSSSDMLPAPNGLV